MAPSFVESAPSQNGPCCFQVTFRGLSWPQYRSEVLHAQVGPTHANSTRVSDRVSAAFMSSLRLRSLTLARCHTWSTQTSAAMREGPSKRSIRLVRSNPAHDRSRHRRHGSTLRPRSTTTRNSTLNTTRHCSRRNGTKGAYRRQVLRAKEKARTRGSVGQVSMQYSPPHVNSPR